MFWLIVGVVMVFLGVGIIVYKDIQSGECEDDYYHDPRPGAGGAA